MYTPPSGIASSCLRSATVSGPAFQACSTVFCASGLLSPGIWSYMKSMPGETTSRSYGRSSIRFSRTRFFSTMISVTSSRITCTPYSRSFS